MYASPREEAAPNSYNRSHGAQPRTGQDADKPPRQLQHTGPARLPLRPGSAPAGTPPQPPASPPRPAQLPPALPPGPRPAGEAPHRVRPAGRVREGRGPAPASPPRGREGGCSLRAPWRFSGCTRRFVTVSVSAISSSVSRNSSSWRHPACSRSLRPKDAIARPDGAGARSATASRSAAPSNGSFPYGAQSGPRCNRLLPPAGNSVRH